MIEELTIFDTFAVKSKNMKQQIINSDFKLGVLGGGQLGKMMALAAGNWHLPLHILDKEKSFPAGLFTPYFTAGDFKNYDDVYAFGKNMDVLTIEIEHVNTEALHQLEKEGVKVHPAPAVLDTIKDKGLQKQFYAEKNIPTAPFRLFADKAAILKAVEEGTLAYPFVQKSRTAGYDGKGVAVIKDANQTDKIMDTPSMVEDLVDIDKELAVIVARNEAGQVISYPVVDMEFNPDANLVEWLVCPAEITEEIAQKADQLAKEVIEAFDCCGLLAVELFLTKSQEILVNEVAPRPHNSGHHTIDSCYTSQFEQHVRAVLNMPLGSTKMKCPSIMVNLLGAPEHTGHASYEGLDECLAMEGVNLHLYGKTTTKPFRKMGHATVVADDLATAKSQARKVKDIFRIVAS